MNTTTTTKRKETFSTYVYKVLKQVHPDMSMSKAGMILMDNFCYDILEQICSRTSHLIINEKKINMTAAFVQKAVRSVVSGEFAKHAVSEGTLAITKFGNNPIRFKKATGGRTLDRIYSHSALAGLQFPVGRIRRLMKKGGYSIHLGGDFNGFTTRLSKNAPVYLAAVIEYLCAEVLEVSGNAARDNKRCRIQPCHIQMAVRNDEELNNLFGQSKCHHISACAIPKFAVLYKNGRDGIFNQCCTMQKNIFCSFMIRKPRNINNNLLDKMIPTHVRRHVLSFFDACTTDKDWLKKNGIQRKELTKKSLFMEAVPVNLRTHLTFEDLYSEKGVATQIKTIHNIKNIFRAVNKCTPCWKHITLTGNKKELVIKLRKVVDNVMDDKNKIRLSSTGKTMKLLCHSHYSVW
jgi:histone H2A